MGSDETPAPDLCVRLTTSKAPRDADVKERTGLPFGAVVRPFKPLAEYDLDPSSIDRLAPADAIARCKECFGYVNGYCGLERDGWICILCGAFVPWDSRAHDGVGPPRYRKNPHRNSLPEICRQEHESLVASEVLTARPDAPIGTSPVYVALIDLTASEEVLDVVRAGVVAAIEAVGEDALFGVVSFDDRVGLYDVSGDGASVVRHVRLAPSGAVAVPLEDALPLERFLCRVGERKGKLVDAVESTRSTRRRGGGGGGGNGGGGGDGDATPRRAFGPALEAVLAWLGADGVGELKGSGGGGAREGNEGTLRHPSCRVLSFLCGIPNAGDGALSSARHDAVSESLASLDPDEAAAAADELFLPQSDFYADAGDRAAVAAVVVDVFSLPDGGAHADLASIAPLTERSGGTLYHYERAIGEDGAASDAPLPRDVFRLLNGDAAVSAHHCSLRLRTSSEFKVANVYGALARDDEYEGLCHVMRCGAEDAFAFDFEHAHREGFGDRGDCPPTIQLAFEYTVLTPLGRGDASGGGGGGGDAAASTSENPEASPASASPPPARYLRQRRRRICTVQARVSGKPRDVFNAADGDVVVALLSHKIFAAANAEGLGEARLLLADWLCILTARYNHECGILRFGAPDADARALDVEFTSSLPLRVVPRLVHALLRHPALRVGPGGASADARTWLRATTSRLEPAALVRTLYPSLSSWRSADEMECPSRSLTRAALATSDAPLWLLDAHAELVVFLKPRDDGSAPGDVIFPPSRDSKLRAVVDAARETRRVTPKVRFVNGAVEDASAFYERLVEEESAELGGGGDGLAGEGAIEGGSSHERDGFVGFLARTERTARTFLREARA